MRYNWFNKQELSKKQKKNITIMVVKKKLLKITLIIKNVLKEKANNVYRNFSEEEKEVKRLYSKDRYSKLKEKSSKVILVQQKLICFLQYKR